MEIRKNWSPASIILVAVFAGGMISAQPVVRTAAQQERPPVSEEERRRVMQRLLDQMQTAQEAARQKEQQQQGKPAAQAPNPPATTGQAPAPVQRAALSADQLQFSFDNADLYDFVNQIADVLGITPIVIDPEVKGSVSIHSSAPVLREDIWPLFNLILKNNNAALVKQGNLYQLVPTSSGLKKGVEIIEHLPPVPPEKPKAPPTTPPVSTPPPGAAQPLSSGQPGAVTPGQIPPGQQPPVATGQPAPAQTPARVPQTTASTTSASGQDNQANRLATHVIRLEFVPVRDLVDAVKIFMTDGGVIMPYDRLNMLIITDYGDSVKKILEIVRMLDDNFLNPDLLDLIEIKYNKSSDVVEDLKKIFGSGAKDSATGIYFVSLDRQNAILVMANSKRALGEAKKWIEKLDATTGRIFQTYVYTVENSTASNIATILSALYGGDGLSGTSGGATTSTPTGGGPMGGTTTGAQTGRGGLSGGTGSGLTGSGFANTGSGGTFGGGGGGGLSGGGGAFGSGQSLGPRLSNTGGTRSQVLNGGALVGLQDTVRMVVDEINNSLIVQSSAADYAYILETIKKVDVLPRQALIDVRIFEVDLTDTLSYGVTSTLQAKGTGAHNTTAGTDAITGALKLSTFAFIGSGREMLMTLDALREKTRVKILESPSLLALDGMEAKIVVGGEVPYPVGTFTPSIGGATTSTQYRETGVSLIIIPRISASGTVTLALAQEVSSPGVATTSGPTFNKTSISSTLAVRDGETVVIAGLIRDSDSWDKSGVPGLAQIPLLGMLFGTHKRVYKRTELIILITPHVIKTPERFQEMTQDLKDTLREIRPFVDKKDKERMESMENARKDRSKREEERPKDPPPVKKPE